MTPRPEKALYDLLCELFDSRELVRFVAHTYGRSLTKDLPDQERLSELAFALASLLQRRGLIKLELFDALANHAPDQRPAIAGAARLWGFSLSPATPQPGPGGAATPGGADTDAGTPVTAAAGARVDAITAAGASPTAGAVAESWHVFISYARVDADPVRLLAENLHRLGLDVFFDEWEVDAGTVVSLRLDQGLRGSRSGILVVSRASVERPWVLQEYATLLQNSVERGQRLIPVLLEEATMPAMLATRRWVDFRGKRGQDYLAAVQELAAAIRGESSKRPARGSPLVTP